MTNNDFESNIHVDGDTERQQTYRKSNSIQTTGAWAIGKGSQTCDVGRWIGVKTNHGPSSNHFAAEKAFSLFQYQGGQDYDIVFHFLPRWMEEELSSPICPKEVQMYTIAVTSLDVRHRVIIGSYVLKRGIIFHISEQLPRTKGALDHFI